MGFCFFITRKGVGMWRKRGISAASGVKMDGEDGKMGVYGGRIDGSPGCGGLVGVV